MFWHYFPYPFCLVFIMSTCQHAYQFIIIFRFMWLPFSFVLLGQVPSSIRARRSVICISESNFVHFRHFVYVSKSTITIITAHLLFPALFDPFNPLTTNDELSCHENLTFLRPGHWGGYLRASRPMLLYVTFCHKLDIQEQWKFWQLKI